MTEQETGIKTKRKPRPCPICHKMSIERYHPFCCGRCANIDLNRWLNGSYAIPAQEASLSSDSDYDEGEK